MFGQRYDAAGVRRGGEFQVNTYTTGGQGSSYYFLEQNSGVAMGPSGNFVVVWGSYLDSQDGSDGSVHGQRYDASGARVGAEFQVNSYTTGFQFGPSIAMRDDSTFVVIWTSYDGDDFGLFGQRFDASGSKVGGEFRCPRTPPGPSRRPPCA